MRLSKQSLRNASILIVASASLFVSRTSWASDWVMGGTQSATSSTQFFTEVLVEFVVPSAPPVYSAPVSIWTGVTGSLPGNNSYTLQPVLIYQPLVLASGSNVGWYMQNEVECTGNNCGSLVSGPGPMTQVFPGDTIFAAVWLDGNTPGGSCNLLGGGGNCNYIMGWYDYTRSYGLNSGDNLLPSSPTYAQGLVFETQPGFNGGYSSCQNFPYQTSVTAQVEMYSWSWSGLYTALNTNLVLGWPHGGGDPNFTDGTFIPNGQGGSISAINACQWHAGVSIINTNVGEVVLNFAQ